MLEEEWIFLQTLDVVLVISSLASVLDPYQSVYIYVPESIGHEAALAMMQNMLDLGLYHSAEKWLLVGW